MAIKIKNLEQIASDSSASRYLYKDIALDITQTKIKAPGYKIAIPGVDINASYDEAAIANSLTNLFNTIPGQRFLFPEYGLNLGRYLFETINEFNGQAIGDKIYRTIEKFEPRVTVTNVNVKLEPDDNAYYITININIPMINTTTSIDYLLDLKSQSFITVQSK